MALTEIPVELSSTPGIADSSNATAITIDSSENVGVGASPNYAKVNITTTGTGAQDRALWVECTPASSGSNNNAMVVNVGNGNMTNTVMRIHHESPAANQKLLSLDTTGSNTEKFWVDEDGDGYFAGTVTMPNQPAFSAYVNAANTNIPTDASAVTVNFGAEYYDQNGDYNTSTYTFTAPVTGKYQLMTNIYVNDADDAAQYIRIRIATSNRNYDQLYDPRVFDTDPTRYNFHSSVLADMDASDTAVIQISQYEGTAQMDIPVSVVNNFSGYLVA